MSTTAYAQVNTVLENFVSTLKLKLGRDLIGVYLYGSCATGDFDENLSDIDLLMVLNDEVDPEQLNLLNELHNNFEAQHEAWRARIDVAYLSSEALRTFKTKPSRVIVSSERGRLKIVDAPEYYLIDWYKVQEHAVTLYGPEATTLVPPITAQEFTKTIYNYMLTWTGRTAKASKRGQQAYAVLTVCRSFYAYAYAKHTSKKAGAQWVAAEYPHWSSLIEKALKWSRDEKNININDAQNQLQTQKFVEFILIKVKN